MNKHFTREKKNKKKVRKHISKVIRKNVVNMKYHSVCIQAEKCKVW